MARPVVVICDDVELTRAKVCALLQRDFEVHSAAEGEEALALCRKLDPDTLVSDLHMPGMDGMGLLREIQEDERLRGLPVILLTGDESQAALIAGLDAGAYDYVRKPVRGRELNARVSGACRLHRARKDLERVNVRLRENQAQLVQSEKLASLGQIAAGVAHEINNPLGFIQSNLKTLQDYTAFVGKLLSRHLALAATLDPEVLGEEARSCLRAARQIEAEDDVAFVLDDLRGLIEESLDGVQRVDTIVKGLKSFCHLDEAEEATLELNEALETTLLLLGPRIGPDCTVVKRYAPLPPLRCLPKEINQVLLSVLSNALQAISEGGEVCVETHADDEALTLRIIDDGSGIAPEHLPHVFDPFFTTRPVGSGSGLGLSTAYGVVKRHRGSITLESEVGRGTTCTVRLPLDPGELSSVTEAA